MSIRLLRTSLAGVVCGACLSAVPTLAADVGGKPVVAPVAYLTQGPAVDGFNSKFEAFGGSISDRGLWGGGATFSLPVQRSWGLQLDFAAASLDSDFFGAGSGHFFWRDPDRGLLGLYGSASHWNNAGGLNSYHFGVEGGWYLDRWSLDGVVGIEGGNSGKTIKNGVIETFDIRTRFFDQVDLSYYLQDNFKLYVGHRYLGGENAAAFGGEWGWALGAGRMAAIFAEGRVGEKDFHGVWGGLKFYFGQSDKTLIQRHRQDDPKNWQNDEISTTTNSEKKDKHQHKQNCEEQPLKVGQAIICAAAEGGCCPG